MHDLEATRLLHSMLRIESPSGREDRAARFLAEELAHHGVEAEVSPQGHVLASTGKGSRSLALISHLHAPVGVGGVLLENGALHAPGAAAGKGPLVAFAAAMVRYARSSRRGPARGAAGGLRIALLGYACGKAEEPGPCPAGLVEALTGGAPDCALLGEASGWSSLCALGAAPEERSGGSKPSRSRKEGSPSRPDRGPRPPLHEALAAAIQRQAADEATQRSPWPSPRNAALTEALAARWDCPLAFYGAGDPRLVGSEHEHVCLDEFTRSIAVLEDMMHELSAVSERSNEGPSRRALRPRAS